MGLLDKAKQTWQEADTEAKAKQAKKDQQKREKEFVKSPAGKARQAYQDGQKYFQTTFDIEQVGKYFYSGADSVRIKEPEEPAGAILSAIEKEGWQLIQTGYVFRQTSQNSVEKLSSGERTEIQGQTVGIYLFRRSR